MNLLFTLIVVVSYPVPQVDPSIVPYHKQPPSSYTVEVERYATSEQCQAVAREAQKLTGKSLPGVKGRVLGAHCLRK